MARQQLLAKIAIPFLLTEMEFVIVQTCIVDVQVFDKAPAILVTEFF